MILNIGSKGTNVKRVQKVVGAAVDGIYGPDTAKHVKTYQKAHGLKVDGVVGPQTWGHMFPPPKPKPNARIIVNDIGHGIGNRNPGVNDPGAVSGGAIEHEWAERFVNAVTKAQKAAGDNVYVIHNSPLAARKAAANADATSWHFNAGGGSGVEVWVPWLAGRAARDHSAAIGKALADAQGLPWRGLKRTLKLAVLNRGFDRLVEVCFIDNPTDRKAHIDHFDAAVAAVVRTV